MVNVGTATGGEAIKGAYVPLRKADSIFQSDTGRTMSVADITYVMNRLVYYGYLPGNWADTPYGSYLFQTLKNVIAYNQTLPRPFDPWFLIAQTWHETDGYSSGYMKNDGNLAGIGIWDDGIPSPWEGKLNPDEAARVYLLELAAHTYTEDEYDSVAESASWQGAATRDKAHLTRLWNLRHSVAWPNVKTISQLNDKVGAYDNVWAADPDYDTKIERKAEAISPSIPDSQGGTTMVNIGNRPLRIAVGAGHRNTSGGNEWEAAMTAKCTNEVVKLCRASKGFDVRCYTPNDGLGFYNGPLDAAAAQVTGWLNAGWPADILHEIHFEGTAPSVRGGFYIYPDSVGLSGRNAGNVDEDVKALAGPMAKTLVTEFGGVCRYSGCLRGMSEKETGVGEDGYRLGVFGAWSETYFNNNSFQMLSEAAAYTNPTDLAIMQQPDFPKKHAIGVLKAYALIAQQRGGWTYPYQIGGTPTTPNQPPANAAPDGLPYPAGFDAGLMGIIFGNMREGNKTYKFSPNGTVSKAWYSHFKPNQNWQGLTWHFIDSGTGREYFGFGGEILWRPTRKDAFRWA